MDAAHKAMQGHGGTALSFQDNGEKHRANYFKRGI
jgi:hypothetical protein